MYLQHRQTLEVVGPPMATGWLPSTTPTKSSRLFVLCVTRVAVRKHISTMAQCLFLWLTLHLFFWSLTVPPQCGILDFHFI